MRLSKLAGSVLPLIFTLGVVTTSAAQTVNTVYTFDDKDGQFPDYEVMAQGRDGQMYGTAVLGGDYSMGSIFKQRTRGTGNILLHSFSGSDGSGPFGGLVLAGDGNFYGVTIQGGTYGFGVLFRITTAGQLTVLYNFTGGIDGRYPVFPPIEAIDGNLYGITQGDFTNQEGTIYRFTPAHQFETIYTFDPTTGYDPFTPLLQAWNGSLYTMTVLGGTYGSGSILHLTTDGVLKNTHQFNWQSDGGFPIGRLIQASDGSVYGTTQGAYSIGTIFRLDKRDVVTTLYTFPAVNGNGPAPQSGVTQGTDGNFYGATAIGGDHNAGSLFELAADQVYTQLYSFPVFPDVPPYQAPDSSLVQHTSGVFYGLTSAGGKYGMGTIYTLDLGLGPFVAFVQPTGKVGKTVQILGEGLTGTTSVTFNGLEATTFSVVSDTYMTAVVPVGATTGAVVVATPAGNLTSNVSFRISK